MQLPCALPPEYDHEAYVGHPHNLGLRGFGETEAWFHYRAHGLAEGRICSAIDGRASFLRLVPAEADLLEIGPFASPAFRRPAYRVRYLDVLDSGMLRQRARDLGFGDNTPEIDYVWRGEPYRALMQRSFRAVFSSHNIEHQPCLIGHLNDIASILDPGGLIFLAIPDKRYCFDHFLPETTIAEVLDAFSDRRSAHLCRSLVQGRIMHAHNDAARHWRGDHGPDPRWSGLGDHFAQVLLDTLSGYRDRSGYLDAHAWQFTPSSFRQILEVLGRMALIGLTVERVYQTLFGSNEFYAVLSRRSGQA